MKKLHLMLLVTFFTFSFGVINASDNLKSIQASIASLDKVSDSNKKEIIRNLIKMNIRYLEHASMKNIAKAEKRIARSKNNIKHCNNNEQAQEYLDQIKLNEENIKTEKELQSAINALKLSL